MGAGKSNSRGVELRTGAKSESIRIKFMYKGAECRETLKLAHTKQNIRYAERLRGEILNAIELGTFDYSAYFPESKYLAKLGVVQNVHTVTIGELVKAYLKDAERTLAPSTMIKYKNNYECHLKQFENTRLIDLNPPMLRAWISKLRLKARTIRQTLIPLRSTLEQAVNDDLIMSNPLDRVKLNKMLTKEAKRVEDKVDPFNAAEIRAILAACKPQERNMFLFAFVTGMRPSEYIALKWSSIDWIGGAVLVERSSVSGITRDETKTEAGRRLIDLRAGALVALQDQRQYTGLQGEVVFHYPYSSGPWPDSSRLLRRWNVILRNAGVRRRNLYQTRHTYASTLLSAGVNALYVAKQMGHRDTTMVTRTYGKWLEQENGELPDFFEKPGPKLAAVK